MPCKKFSKFLDAWKGAQNQHTQSLQGDAPRVPLPDAPAAPDSGPRHYCGSQQLVTSHSAAIDLAVSPFHPHHAGHVHAFKKYRVRDGELVVYFTNSPSRGHEPRGASHPTATSPITPAQTSANDDDNVLHHVVQQHYYHHYVKQSESQPQLGSAVPQDTARDERGRSLSPKSARPTPKHVQQHMARLPQQTGSSPPNQMQKSSSSPPELPSTSTHHGANAVVLPQQPQLATRNESGAMATSAMLGISDDQPKPLDLILQPPGLLEHVHQVLSGVGGLGEVKGYGSLEQYFPPQYHVIDRFLDTCIARESEESNSYIDRGSRLVAVLGGALLSDVSAARDGYPENLDEKLDDPVIDRLRDDVAAAVARVCAIRLGEDPPPDEQATNVALQHPSQMPTTSEAQRGSPRQPNTLAPQLLLKTPSDTLPVPPSELHDPSNDPKPSRLETPDHQSNPRLAANCKEPKYNSWVGSGGQKDVKPPQGASPTNSGQLPAFQQKLELPHTSMEQPKHVLASPPQVSFARWTQAAESSGRSYQGSHRTGGSPLTKPHASVDDLASILDTARRSQQPAQATGDRRESVASGQLPLPSRAHSAPKHGPHPGDPGQRPSDRGEARDVVVAVAAAASGVAPLYPRQHVEGSSHFQPPLKSPLQPPHVPPGKNPTLAEAGLTPLQRQSQPTEPQQVAPARVHNPTKPLPPCPPEALRKRQAGATHPTSNAPTKRPKLEPSQVGTTPGGSPAPSDAVRLGELVKAGEKKAVEVQQKADGGVGYGTPTVVLEGAEAAVAAPTRQKKTPQPKKSPGNPQNAALLQLDMSKIANLEQFWTAVRQHYSESANISKQYRILFQDWEGDWLMHKKTQALKGLKGRAQKVYIMAT